MAPTAAAASKKRTHINYNSYFVSIENELIILSFIQFPEEIIVPSDL
jgi:hypothetical protein